MGIITKFWRWWYRYHPTPSHYSQEEALTIAREYHLEKEVKEAMENGYNPDEALQEWDLFPFQK